MSNQLIQPRRYIKDVLHVMQTDNVNSISQLPDMSSQLQFFKMNIIT